MLDGAMGTQLIKENIKMGKFPETTNITYPEVVTKIHKEYIEAGSKVIYTNTFGVNRKKIQGTKYKIEEIITSAIKNAKVAVENNDCKIALDIGPIGEMLKPNGTLTFEEAYEIFREQVEIGKKSGIDIISIETMTDLLEAKIAVLAAKETSDLPIFVTMTFDENGRTFSGVSPETFAITMNGLGVEAIGINCSLGPKEMLPLIEAMSAYTNLPLIVKSNAGIPCGESNKYNVSPSEFASYIDSFVKMGVTIFGGCCGTDPTYIEEVRKVLKNLTPNRVEKKLISTVCSSTKYINIDQVRIIGEKINPTGKGLLQKAILDRNYDYILKMAIAQVHAGADILDINLGFPGSEESEVMGDVVKSIQSVIDVPLQIDSASSATIEAGIRYYNGKPIINSVNGTNESLDAILPLVKKYGAAVVGLTFDENGVPKSVEGRVNVARAIMNRALSYGIPKEDIFIDPLTLTISSLEYDPKTTLDAIEIIKNQLGLKTLLGISNISFGLPYREMINCNFLTFALAKGLDLPIINPNSRNMMNAIKTFKILSGQDRNRDAYFQNCSEELSLNLPNKELNLESDNNSIEDLAKGCIKKGLPQEGKRYIKELLKTYSPIEIINNILVDALDSICCDFKLEKIFLPQLIRSACCAQEILETIKGHLSVKENTINKGKIVLATVKGDIHDIGKNITKVILESYGYEIYDLGKDTDKKKILAAVKNTDAKLVGLSALMTTTVINMEETIDLLKSEVPDCKIMVGGAVLSGDYSSLIGADYYVSDANMSVEVAREIYPERDF